MIGVGPASRAMGGTGTAAAQHAISSIFSSPAAPGRVKGDSFNFAGTWIAPAASSRKS